MKMMNGKKLGKKLLVKLQLNQENRIWKNFVQLSLDEFEKIYKRLDIEFNLYFFESFYVTYCPKVISLLEEKNHIIK